MRRVALGDSAALAVLYERHAGWSLALATRILGSAEEGEEAVQESFLELWRRAGQYSPERAAPGAWLATILRSRALDRRRKSDANQRAVQSEQRQPEPERTRPTDELLALGQDAARLRVAMKVLSPEQRLCIELAWLEGLSHSEVAKKTGMPIGTVKTRIRAGLERLSREL